MITTIGEAYGELTLKGDSFVTKPPCLVVSGLKEVARRYHYESRLRQPTQSVLVSAVDRAEANQSR